MGSDSVKPFLGLPNKWVIVLGLTSNEGAFDFQFLNTGNKKLFEEVISTSATWGNERNMMYVVGATKAESLKEIRKIIPNHFLLVPGVGAQGGSLEEVCEYGMNKDIGLLINSSRGIIYASSKNDFAQVSQLEASKIHESMKKYC
jgi:orotidine-5'-phosphate decarboxylase